ncbi:MAG: right-handed parallel beta-helix repeat-containing protein [Saprospiraceae bacterium]
MKTSVVVPFILLFLLGFNLSLTGSILHVGSGYPFTNFSDATEIAVPGDTVLVHEGIYTGDVFVSNLQGTSSSWIYILAAEGDSVIFDGGTNAWQFTDAAYLYIRGFIFQHQTGNGLNFDDGGTYATPTHHIKFENCIFRDMNASGNNDLLKLSGLDDFEILHCTFLNGAEGGSGIDMVGCHDGLIKNNHFEHLGSNSIQAKGGTRNIRIEANLFKDGGLRAVNLGGSTDLQFFRPIDAPYEAADLKVYSNIFIGSQAPVAFVGCINTEVINNTMYLPEKWVLRILQETVDPDRFPPCGNNTFRNNIIFLDEQVVIECNIGPNTAPETFTFSNNLWFHEDDLTWDGPDLPVVDVDNIVEEDPLFVDAIMQDFSLLENSPAIGKGYGVSKPEEDFTGIEFLIPRSIGAYEGGVVTGIYQNNTNEDYGNGIRVWPNPGKNEVNVSFNGRIASNPIIKLLDGVGREVRVPGDVPIGNRPYKLDTTRLPSGFYTLILISKSASEAIPLMIL